MTDDTRPRGDSSTRRRSVTFKSQVDVHVIKETVRFEEPRGEHIHQRSTNSISFDAGDEGEWWDEVRPRTRSFSKDEKVGHARGTATTTTISIPKLPKPGVCFEAAKVFTLDECEALIQKAEDHGFVAAKSAFRASSHVPVDRWQHFEVREIADMLALRLAPLVVKGLIPEEWPEEGEESSQEHSQPRESSSHDDRERWELAGIHHSFHISKYTAGDFFKPHLNPAVGPMGLVQSKITFLVYLNGKFDKGRTKFYASDSNVKHFVFSSEFPHDPDHATEAGTEEHAEPAFLTTPQTGACLVFQQQGLVCEGEEVGHGVKYVLRGDILYAHSRAKDEVKNMPITALT